MLALSLLAVVAASSGIWLLRRPKRLPPLPTEWALSARPVFSTDERRVYKLLREALPHHIVLSKLPLVRFCQPSDPERGALLVRPARRRSTSPSRSAAPTAACSPRSTSTPTAATRAASCRSSSRCSAPAASATCAARSTTCRRSAELQLLVPSSTAATARGPQPGIVPPRDLDEARDSLASTVATRRAQRTRALAGLVVFQDSFFAPDSRLDSLGNSEFASLSFAEPAHAAARSATATTPSPAGAPQRRASTRQAGDDGDEPAASSSTRRRRRSTSRSHH